MEAMKRRTSGRVAGLVLEAILQLRCDPARQPETSHLPTNRLGASHGQRSAGVVASLLAVLLVCLLPTSFTAAQSACSPGWLPGAGVPGVNGNVSAMVMWDPDGPGPRAPVLVVGGEFTVAGDAIAKSVAMWDPATGAWAAMGSFPGYATVNALAVLPSGELIAGGFFRYTTGYAVSGIARYRGGAWQLVDGGPAGTVHALAVLPSGGVVAAGRFYNANATQLGNIARWDGTETGAWLPMGEGLAASLEDEVYALAVLPGGDVVAGGDFGVGVPLLCSNVARWDGVAWSALGEGITGRVYSLAALPDGTLAAGGELLKAGDRAVGGIVRWDGTSWSAFASTVGPESDFVVRTIVELAGGDMLVGGYLSFNGGATATGVARWNAANGGSWSIPGTGIDLQGYGAARSIVLMPNGVFIAGGYFITAGGTTVSNIARFDGDAQGTWSPLSSGTDGDARAFAQLPDGGIVVAGSFTTIGGIPANRIAVRASNGAWSPLGAGLDGEVYAVAVLPNGDVIAGGYFATAGGVSARNIARWDGLAWSALGSGVDGVTWALAVLPDGTLAVGGSFAHAGGVLVSSIALWNGAQWSALGTGLSGGYPTFVAALAVLPNGDLVVGGSFSSAGGIAAYNIARWNSSGAGTWSALGTGVAGNVFALAVLPSGELIVGGDFFSAGGMTAYNVAAWSGTAWSALGFGIPYSISLSALGVLASGDLVAGGEFSFDRGFNMVGLARWDGHVWTAFERPIDAAVWSLAVLPNGDLVAGGSFAIAGDNVSAQFALYPAGKSPPSIASQPESVFGCPSTTLGLVVTASGDGPFTYHWRLRGVPVDLGANPSAGSAALVVSDLQTGNAGLYDCIVSNACGSTASDTASVTIRRRADLVGGGYLGLNPDGITDGSDFIAFINSFSVGDANLDPIADIAGGGPDGIYSNGIIDSEDFVAFINAFVNGC